MISTLFWKLSFDRIFFSFLKKIFFSQEVPNYQPYKLRNQPFDFNLKDQ